MSRISPIMACIKVARYAKSIGVAFKILADGSVETDSLEEALQIRKAILKEASKEGAEGQKPSERLSKDTANFILALADGPLTSEEAAKAANISTKAIPPLIRGLGIWSKRHGINLSDAIIRTQKWIDRKPVSTYQLTEYGAEQFEPYLIEKSSDGAPTESHKEE